MNTTRTRTVLNRHGLLATVSIAALLSAGASAQAANDADRPLLWIEVGGQLSQLSGRDEPLVPHFADVAAQHNLISLAPLEAPSRYSLDELAGVSFQPPNSTWHFNALVQYGKSASQKHKHEQFKPDFYHNTNWGFEEFPDRNGRTAGQQAGFESGHITFGDPPLADYASNASERHLILDFQAGKDVGLGLLGHGSISQIAVGIRIAQFTSQSKLKLSADPYPHMAGFKYLPPVQHYFYTNIYDQYYKASPELKRSFRGLGPLLSWSGSAAMIDLDEDSSIAFDWDFSAAFLFGRQKAHVQHRTSGTQWAIHIFPKGSQQKYETSTYVHHTKIDRSRNVTVPNVGGLAGISLKFPNAKVSIGYRADFFFGALDGGVDARRSETRGFYGPYVSLSIGISPSDF